jgi:hypothetical protein
MNWEGCKEGRLSEGIDRMEQAFAVLSQDEPRRKSGDPRGHPGPARSGMLAADLPGTRSYRAGQPARRGRRTAASAGITSGAPE